MSLITMRSILKLIHYIINRRKNKQSYIYNLVYLEEHYVMKFNIILEVEREEGYPTRMTAVLEYLPDKKSLRIITLH